METPKKKKNPRRYQGECKDQKSSKSSKQHTGLGLENQQSIFRRHVSKDFKDMKKIKPMKRGGHP